MAGPLKKVHATTSQQCMYFELFSVAAMVYADSPVLFHPAFRLMQCTVGQQAWYQAFICALTTVTNLLLWPLWPSALNSHRLVSTRIAGGGAGWGSAASVSEQRQDFEEPGRVHSTWSLSIFFLEDHLNPFKWLILPPLIFPNVWGTLADSYSYYFYCRPTS